MPSTPSFVDLFGKSLPEVVPRLADGESDKEAAAGLALSGGGYRAMLFHLGALRRLYEVGALQNVARISSVSGGSIASAHLALVWDELIAGPVDTDTFDRLLGRPLMQRADTLLDAKGIVGGLLTPRRSIAGTVLKTYDDWFAGATLRDLPSSPRFVFCATNLGSGAVVRFAKDYAADYRVGVRHDPDFKLSSVVAASAAFPPVLSPMTMDLDGDSDLSQLFAGDNEPVLHKTRFSGRLQLSDGGVYDNLGLQPIERFATQLVSDGGGPFQFEEDVATNWLQHMIRAWKVTDNQVRSLRRSELISAYQRGALNGAFWGISTVHSDYGAGSLPVDDSWTGYLKSISTRLAPIDEARKQQLVNFSYCLCDAALERYVVKEAMRPAPSLPFPDHPLSGPAPEAVKKPFWKFWTT